MKFSALRRFFYLPAVIVCAIIIGGCAPTEDSSVSVNPARNVVLNEPKSADLVKLKFQEMPLDSAVKRVDSEKGIVYLNFQFTDTHGEMHPCQLPEPMSQGEYTENQWREMFFAYKMPKVVKKKEVKVKKQDDLNDFPFIAPKIQPLQGN